MPACSSFTQPSLNPSAYRRQYCQPGLLVRYQVGGEDTMTHLALKYGTTIGHICRANCMYCQDVLQKDSKFECRTKRSRAAVAKEFQRTHSAKFSTQTTGTGSLRPTTTCLDKLPAHFFRQSSPNSDDFAEDCDPLLITETECI